MTSNQIAFWTLEHTKAKDARALQETERSNRARETETQRSNLAKERETWRSNLANEAERLQHNRANLMEMTRSNVARETETARSNLAREEETRRSNRAGEFLEVGAQIERSRHNRVYEVIDVARALNDIFKPPSLRVGKGKGTKSGTVTRRGQLTNKQFLMG